MAKKKEQVQAILEETFFADFAKAVGGTLLEDIGQNRGLIDTGILALNFAISGKFVGGGLPVGITAEVYGESSSGKTLIGTNLLWGVQQANGIAVFLDAERTISKDFAVRASYVNPRKLVVMEADTLEGCFNKIFTVIRRLRDDYKVPLDRPIMIVYDSIAVSPSEREFAETTLDLETASVTEIKNAGAGADKPGERARICGKELRKLTPYLQENNATVLFINQMRKMIGASWGTMDDRTTAGGGQALPYYCSTRISMNNPKRLKNEDGKILGVSVGMSCMKNKITRPFTAVRNIPLYFDHGIDPFGGLLELLLQDGRVKNSSSGVYLVGEQYTGGKEVKFRASKENNKVPLEILLEYPALVDATCAEDLTKYTNRLEETAKGEKAVASVEEITEE